MIKDISNVEEVLRQLASLDGNKVEVGIIDDAARYDDEVKVIDIGYIQEFGFIGKDKNGRKMNIPERPFIRGTFDNKKTDIIKEFEHGLVSVVEERLLANQMLNDFGNWGVSLTQEYMTDLKTPPNAPSTIRKKGSSNPLIDTGHLRTMIEFEVGGNNK